MAEARRWNSNLPLWARCLRPAERQHFGSLQAALRMEKGHFGAAFLTRELEIGTPVARIQWNTTLKQKTTQRYTATEQEHRGSSQNETL